MKKNAILMVIFGLMAGAMYWVDYLNLLQVQITAGHTLWSFFFLVFSVLGFQQALVVFVHFYVRSHKGPDGEIKMLASFLGVVAGLGIILALMYSLGVLKTIGVVAAGFAGMLLGWSLQAPVSGLAAWILVTLMRPFRVSDRVLFPSLGLTGDVKKVGLMYTVLNQVGGAIGSEEAIGRDILIPNAMLFSQVAINYTPRAVSSYFLDEVVIRLTFDSDWDTAERVMLEAARAVTGPIIEATAHEPYIRSDIWDYGILMRLRYMTMAKDRPRITHELVRHIFKSIQSNPKVDMAIPFVYSYRKGSSSTQRRQFPEPEGAMKEVAADDILDGPSAPLDAQHEEEIQQLMRNIQQRGLLQSILVSRRSADGKYTVLAGHLRLIACKRLGWATIPVVIRG